ncbi:integral membrane sensor signal transduction histidine kinase [Alkaliphilus metalliredigens QYMF]|uniref:histidine kinase n=1 Tax=Alkaliphilus metalliredigens (strain QYMF) TaxID=293826 RepID=A6TL66_ALKMQ|nr:HAMP domain-containing sensor histidine kinase [Alkaliphilus metalliredigens]ABR46934.1 integral membrane sensor signal transduction histidine kinase [Alkaliphilus metalliredigens QYMF]
MLWSSIKQKLIVIYIVLIFIPLALINYLSIENMTRSVLREIEINSLKTANVVSSLSRNYFDDAIELKGAIRQYSPSIEGRILVLDNQKRVLVDSFSIFENEHIDNAEIRAALKGEEQINYYEIDKRILQVAVPIFTGAGEGRVGLGVVLISTDVEDAFVSIDEFRRQLRAISIGAAIVGLLVAAFASVQIAKPISSLSKAAKKIGQGELGKQVEVKGRDEISRLGENFNQMSEALYRMDQSKKQFIGDVSHELKTPLASMKALIDSLLYGEDDIEIYREYLGDMDSEIDRLSNLIRSLLSLTKIEGQDLNLDTVNLEALLRTSIKIVKPLIEKAQVEIKVDFQDAPMIICDEERIKEVLINLIDNGIKYRDDQKEVQWIVIEGRKEKESYVLYIKDNGLGIGEAHLELIFDQFYRVDLSRSRETGGAGLGLSIVNRILARHDWTMRAESQLNQGTSLIIEIPKTSFSDSL